MKNFNSFTPSWTKNFKVFFCLIFILGLCVQSLNAQDKIQIGGDSSITSDYFPLHYLYNYSYSQTIYTAEEMQGQGAVAGTITKLYYLPTSSQSTSNWKDWVIYIGHTEKQGFSNMGDWIEVSQLEEVFNGTIDDQVTASQWLEITLDSGFEWDGESNIVVAVNENTNGWGNDPNWSGYTLQPVSGSKGIYYYEDNVNPNPENPPIAGSTTNTVAKIQFYGDLLETCEGDVDAGTLVESELEVCEGIAFNLAVEGATSPANGLERIWQSSPAGENDWTDIEGASTPNYPITNGISEPTDYRFKVVCNDGEAEYSEVLEVTLKPGEDCYCTPVYTSECTSNANIVNVSLAGESESLDNDSACSPDSYGDYTSDPDVNIPDLIPSETYTLSVTTGSAPSSKSYRAWIDYNKNGNFEDDEEIAYVQGMPSSATSEVEFALPEDVEPGNYRLRVRLLFGSSADVQSCSSTGWGEAEDYTVEILQLETCEGNVDAGTLVESELEICAGIAFNLTVEGASTPADGLVRTWQSSPSGENDWIDIEDSNTSSYPIINGISESTDFRFKVVCNDGEAQYSGIMAVSLLPGKDCYCTPVYTTNCTSNANIINVSLAGESESLDNDSGCSPDSYGDYTSDPDVNVPDLIPGETYTLSVSSGTNSPSSKSFRAWIDYNNNGNFEDNEEIAYVQGMPSNATSQVEFALPEDVEPGNYRLRVRLVYGNAGEVPSCSSTSWGEAEDYTVEILHLETCEGEVTAGTIEDDFAVCLGKPFSLSVTGATDPANGLVRQWQSSPVGGDDWTDIEGGYSNPFTIVNGITEDTDFRYVLSCNDGAPVYSDVLHVSLKPEYECYCEPTYLYGCSNYNITNVSLVGESEILNNATSCDGNGYSDFSELAPADLAPGETYELSVTTGYSLPQYVDVKIWVDFDLDGIFTEDELIGSTTEGFDQATESFEIVIPEGMEVGEYRMRVRLAYNLTGYTGDPCSQANYGETEDYTISIIQLEDCSGTPDAGVIDDDLSICAGNPFTVSVTNASTSSNNLVRQWQSSPAGENDWTNIEGANFNNHTVTEGIMENTDFRFTVTCNDEDTQYSEIMTVSVKPGAECYCTPIGFSNNSDEILNFSLGDFSNDSSPSEGESGYNDYTDLGPIQLTPGIGYAASLTGGTGSGTHGAAIWIDYNDDGIFSEDEKVAYIGNTITASSTVDFPEFVAGNEVGLHRLRVQYHYNKSGEVLDPCTASFPNSETEDYTVEILDINCLPPTGISIQFLTDNSAQVIWNGGDNDGSWKVYYGESGFNPDTEGNSMVVSEPVANITGLVLETDYQVYVKSVCDQDEESPLIGPVSFTTHGESPENTRVCDAIELTPNAGCFGGTYTNEGAFEEAYEPTGSCLNIFRGTNSVWFTFVATDTQATISIDLNMELVAFEAPEDCGDLSTLGVEVGCATPTEDLVLNGLTHGAIYYIKVTGFNNTSGDFCIQVQMDDVPVCEDPSDIVVTHVEDTTAILEWTANGNETQWEVAFGLAGFDLETQGQTEVVNTNSIELTNLNPQTDYDVFVRAVCNNNITSDWVGPETFTTEPMSVNSEAFNNFIYYPNPVQNLLTLKASAQIEKVEVFNLLGQSIIIQTPEATETQLVTDQLQSGVYLMKVTIGKAEKTFRVVKR